MRATLIINPTAGPTRPKPSDWDWLVERLRVAGWSPVLAITGHEGHARELARGAVAAGHERVVVVGGDGTINEILQEIAGRPISLAILPAGTANVLATELGIPSDLEGAAAVLTGGQVLSIDLGRANGRYFSMMTGIGYDAQTTANMWPELKKRFGTFAYGVAGIQAFMQYKATRMRIWVDDRKRPLRRLAYMLVASNTRLYGVSGMRVSEQADVRDGLLDITLFRTRRWYRLIFSFLKVFTGRGKRLAEIEVFRAKKLRVSSARPVPYQLDGDPAGTTPLTIEVCPLALSVIVP